jgi:hypothetical protein
MSLRNPYVPTFVTLRTRLSPEECCRRLQPLTLPWISLVLVIPWAFSKLPVMGWVRSTGFAVRKVTVSPSISTMMQPEARAQFVVAPDGTRMRVRLGVRRWIAISSWIGLAYMIIFLEGFIFLLCRFQPNPRCDGPFTFLWPLVIPVTLELLAWLGAKQVVRDESAFLVHFLEQTLEAEEILESPAPLG